MPRRIIVLSGPIASGKTTLGDTLVERYGFFRLKTRRLIQTMLGTEVEREALQKAGIDSTGSTRAGGFAQALSRALSEQREDLTVLVDAARIPEQVEGIRRSFGPRVVHVHLTAPPEVLAERYAHRDGEVRELESYDDVRTNPTERRVERLAKVADIVIDTGRCSDADVHARVAGHLGLFGRSVERLVDVLVGGQYGSEGKGHIASYVAPEYDVLLRVGGQMQVTPCTRSPNRTRFITYHQVLAAPSTHRARSRSDALGPEADRGNRRLPGFFTAPFDRPQAMIIEEADRDFETKSLKKSIGSTAQGVGHATARKILRSAADPQSVSPGMLGSYGLSSV